MQGLPQFHSRDLHPQLDPQEPLHQVLHCSHLLLLVCRQKYRERRKKSDEEQETDSLEKGGGEAKKGNAELRDH